MNSNAQKTYIEATQMVLGKLTRGAMMLRHGVHPVNDMGHPPSVGDDSSVMCNDSENAGRCVLKCVPCTSDGLPSGSVGSGLDEMAVHVHRLSVGTMGCKTQC